MAYPNSLFIQVQTTISSCYRLTWDVLETTNQYPCAGRGVAAQTPKSKPLFSCGNLYQSAYAGKKHYKSVAQ